MTTPQVRWSRFWSSREATLQLDGYGYLCDPDSRYGAALNPGVVPIEVIMVFPCLVLLGEPGMGKTTALDQYRAEITEYVSRSGDRLLAKNLNAFQTDVSLHRSIFESDCYRRWLAGEGALHLFLDSLDECLARVDTVAAILKEEFARCPVERLRLRMTCRTAEWPASLERRLRDLWGKDAVGIFELAPLRRVDVGEAARASGLDPERFLAEVESREVVPLATRPVTLRFLLNTFALGRELPRTQAELYRVGCRVLCEESSESRRSSPWLRGHLDSPRRLAVAERIAAAVVFCGRPAIWMEPDRGDVPEGDLTVADLIGGHEIADGEPFSVTESAVREVLDTGLFSSRGVGRLGFAHQTYAEFLAAHYLNHRGVGEAQASSLLLHPDDVGGKVVPQLHEAAAWLAGIEPAIFRRIMHGDPQVLLRGDVASADAGDRHALVGSLLRLFDAGALTDSDWDLRSRYRQLDHPGLADQLAPYIQDRSKGRLVRRFAIDLAESCRATSIQGLLADVALDPEDDAHVRSHAAAAVARIGDEATRLRLRPCLMGDAGPDPDDELKGWSLRALWPGLISIEEVLAAYTSRPSLLGSYSSFLYRSLSEQIAPEDLLRALDWAARQTPDEDSDFDVRQIVDGLAVRALQSLDDPRVRDAFVNLVAARLAAREPLPGRSSRGRELGMLGDPVVRRQVVLSVLPRLIAKGVEPSLLFFRDPQLLTSGDVPWMLERLEGPAGEVPQPVWARLIRSGYNTEPEQTEAILAVIARHEDLEREFRDLIQPMELDSELARVLRAHHDETELWRGPHEPAPVEPPPAIRIEQCLAACEAGNQDGWWWLNMQLTLTSDSTYYGDEAESDLTALPGWQAADEATRARIVEAAARYLASDRELDEGWIEGDYVHWPTRAGYRALRLLDAWRPGTLEGLDARIWMRWAPSVLDFSRMIGRGSDEAHRRLLRLAYKHASERVIEILLRLIDRDNERHGHLIPLEGVLDRCWDTRLAAALVAKARDERLKAPCLGQLLRALLGRGVREAEDLVRAMVPIPLPAGGEPRARALAAASALLDAARDGGWSVIEPMMRLDPAAGRELFLSVAFHDSHASLSSRLTEDRLAELYRWLVEQFPYHEDPRVDGFHAISNREQVGSFRDAVLRHLKHRGTPEARRAVERLAAELPNLAWLWGVVIEAAAITLQQTWRPPSPADLFALVTDRRKRLIESGSQLLEVLAESIARLEQELQGETPLAPALWDEVRQGVFHPKDENWLSDFVAAHLRRDLGAEIQ